MLLATLVFAGFGFFSESSGVDGAMNDRPVRSKAAEVHAFLMEREALSKLPDEALRELLTPKQLGQLIAYEGELSRDDRSSSHYCWAPGTPPAVLEAFGRVETVAQNKKGQPTDKAFQTIGRGYWIATATEREPLNRERGQARVLTWSLASDGSLAPGLNGEADEASDLISWLDGIYGGEITDDLTERVWFRFFEEATNDLAERAGITLIYEPNDDGARLSGLSSSQGEIGIRGDIRIGGRFLDGDRGVLAVARPPDQGEITFDTSDDAFTNLALNSRFLVNVLTHELGHALGLGHVCPLDRTKLMEPVLTVFRRGAQFDETYSLQRQYGDALERQENSLNNDTAADASSIIISNQELSTWKYLSIDDDEDVDFLRFEAEAFDTLTVRLLPGGYDIGPYLEGPQLDDGTCSEGELFSPSIQQDLGLELIDADGETVLASASSHPAGEIEELVDFVLQEPGSYFLRVSGSQEETSQLYELQAQLTNSPPRPVLEITGLQLLEESNSGGNQVPDPGETVRYEVTIRNTGERAAENLALTLSGPEGLLSFLPSSSIPLLSPGASVQQEFLFALTGSCGDAVPLTIEAESEGGFSQALRFSLQLGKTVETFLLDESFDSDASLPEGWVQSTIGAGEPWTVEPGISDTLPNAIRSEAIATKGDSILVSPGIVLTNEPSVLSFRHSYDLQANRDGAVLQASLDGGGFFDLIQSNETTVLAGDYDGRILGNNPNFAATIRGSIAWTGTSDGFISTEVALPETWAGQEIQFRWILSHNSSGAGEDWVIDTIRLTGGLGFECDPFRPVLELSSPDTLLVEGDPRASARLLLSTSLPLARAIAVQPLLEGQANRDDFEQDLLIVLPVGTTQAGLSLSAVYDQQDEPTEAFQLSLSSDAADFAVGEETSVSLMIQENTGTFARIEISDRVAVFNGQAQGVTVTTEPPGLAFELTYDEQSIEPTNAARYEVRALISEPGFFGTAFDVFEIIPAPATLGFSGLETLFTGNPQSPVVTTSPANLPFRLTFDNQPVAPSAVGSFAVVAEITDLNFEGRAEDIFTIEESALSWLEDFGIGIEELFEDIDDDGWPSLAEYLYGTDPLERDVAPFLQLQLENDRVRINTPILIERPDVFVVGEQSLNLEEWTELLLEPDGRGFVAPQLEQKAFFRLQFEYDPSRGRSK